MDKNDFCKETKTEEEIEMCIIEQNIDCDGCKYNGSENTCTNVNSCRYEMKTDMVNQFGCCKFSF